MTPIELLTKFQGRWDRLTGFDRWECEYCGSHTHFKPDLVHKKDCPILQARQLIERGEQ